MVWQHSMGVHSETEKAFPSMIPGVDAISNTTNRQKRFGTSQFVEIVIVIIVVIRVMSLKEGFNRVVRRGVGEVEACGRISSFPLPTSSSQPAVSSCTIQSTVAGLALQCSHCTHLLKSVSGLLAALQNHCTVYFTIAVTTGIITKVSASSVHWGRCEESTTDLG